MTNGEKDGSERMEGGEIVRVKNRNNTWKWKNKILKQK